MDFYRRVAVVCREIPYGKVVTYGQIALLCGKPRNARQLGSALNHKVAGEDIPAFRVVNTKGILSGAAAFEMPGLQCQLLEAEGVRVDEGERVDLNEFGWKNTMDDALRFRDYFEQEGI